MPLAPQFLQAHAMRCRHQAARARRLAKASTTDDAAAELAALASRLEHEAAHDEEEALLLEADLKADGQLH
jgi:hypothetical protein